MKLEEEMKLWLEKNNIEYIYQYRDKIFGVQSLDFYLPKYNVAIECQGEQHYIPVKYFGGVSKFKKTKRLDNLKKEICENNGIKLIYYVSLKKYQTKSTNEIHYPKDLLNLL